MPDCWLFTALTLGLVSLVGSPIMIASEKTDTTEPKSPTIRHPAFLTRYDLATRDDLFAARMLDPLIQGDQPDEWTVLQSLDEQLGEWITPFLTANKIANTIRTS